MDERIWIQQEKKNRTAEEMKRGVNRKTETNRTGPEEKRREEFWRIERGLFWPLFSSPAQLRS